MKKVRLAILLLCSTLTAFGATPNPADYNLTVHVIASKIRLGPQVTYTYIKAVIDGKKYELSTINSGLHPLVLGDYKAKAIELPQRNSYDLFHRYEFLMPDGKTRLFEVSGLEQ